MIYKKNKKEGGYALIISLVFFLASGTAVVASLSDSILREVKNVRNESYSKQAYLTSESAMEDSIYRIKNGKQIGTTENLTIGASTASVVITTAVDDSKDIVSSGDLSNTVRKTQATLDVGTGGGFPYVLQTGVGGIDFISGSITGDIYTTGSIRGCSGCSINGFATAAGVSSSDIDIDNTTPTTPSQSISFANNNSTQDLAQSFSVSDDLSLTGLKIYIKKIGNPSNATIKITDDNSGKPGSTILASGTLSSSLVSTSYSLLNITLTANPVLTTGTTYWVVIDANTSSSNYYVAGANTSYTGGQAKIGRLSTNSWGNTSPAGLDMYFQIYIGKNEKGISGQDMYNILSATGSYSYNASYLSVSGSLYCQVGVSNNKSCDTSRGDPPELDYPVTDSMITDWKAEALAGGVYTGNYSVGFAGANFGPKKIVGNLTVSGGGTLTVTGTLWVTGTVTINGGATVRPTTATKSFAIISDSSVNLSGGADITGSTGNHIMLVSTSSADPAVTINGGANDTVLYAPNGGIMITGGASAKAASAEHITVDGGADLIYDPDVSNLNFSSGSGTGGTFGIKTWKETQ